MNLLKPLVYPCAGMAEADLSLAQTLLRWADAEVIGRRLEHKEDYAGLLLPAMRKLFLDIELQQLVWPEEYGGAGHSSLAVARTLTAALEQVGRADTGIGLVYAATFALSATFALQESFNEALCARYAPLFCDPGRLAVGSLVLPLFGSADSDPALSFQGRQLQAAARRDGADWVVSGRDIRPLCAGSDAALFGVYCALEGEAEPGFILVPAGAPGIRRQEPFLKTGLAASVNCRLDLEAVRVPQDHLVFRGEQPYRRMLAWLYLGLGAVTAGSLLASYEILAGWGDSRVIKGGIFKENPLAAALMAEVAHQGVICRLLVHQLASMFASPLPAAQPGGEETLFAPALSVVSEATRMAERALNQTMELMGSAGYAREWNLERYWRDVKTLQLHLGSWELNKLALARCYYRCETV